MSGAPALGGIDAFIDDAVGALTTPFVRLVFATFPGTDAPWIVLWLVIGALVCTIAFGGVQFRSFRHAVHVVAGRYSHPDDKGEVTQFQALATALSGTVGLGNIAGVAVAVSVGGPGATFWMIVAGLLGMATKFAECTLGVKYRILHADGRVSGGPMHYLSQGLGELGRPRLGKALALAFAACCVLGALGGGNMFQANQAHAQIVAVTGGADSPLSGQGWITGLLLAALVFAVIVGGLRSIARVTSRIVPAMAMLYVGTAIAILVVNAPLIPWAFGQILAGAFTEAGIAGGALGALLQGFRRAAFSNEAGIGSAAIAHAAARTREPVSEGMVALLEPFIDTVVICTMTALVIVISGILLLDPETGRYIWDASAGRVATAGDVSGVALTSAAFGAQIAWFPNLLAVAVVLFAFSTMIAWSYYGLKSWTYLAGDGPRRELGFKLVFCLFVVFGAAMDFGAVIDFSDAAIFAMAVANLVGVYLLLPVLRRDVASYMRRVVGR